MTRENLVKPSEKTQLSFQANQIVFNDYQPSGQQIHQEILKKISTPI